MTLRADIISAYDEIAPPAPHLEAQIRASVSAEARVDSPRSRRRQPWIASLRGTMALVAALLVVIIVATVLIGGRVMHDWAIFNTRPAPAGQVDAATQIELLEARPLHLPQMTAGACVPGPFTTVHYGSGVFYGAYGAGPAYGVGGAGHSTSWGFYFDVMFVTDPKVTGWVLVRGRDAVNHSIPVVYIGAYAAGAVIGTDTVNGQLVTQRSEFLVDASHHPASSGKSKWGIWNVTQGITANGWSNCTAFQLDGNGFSEVFVG
jgi:hypothetical protein